MLLLKSQFSIFNKDKYEFKKEMCRLNLNNKINDYLN